MEKKDQTNSIHKNVSSPELFCFATKKMRPIFLQQFNKNEFY